MMPGAACKKARPMDVAPIASAFIGFSANVATWWNGLNAVANLEPIRAKPASAGEVVSAAVAISDSSCATLATNSTLPILVITPRTFSNGGVMLPIAFAPNHAVMKPATRSGCAARVLTIVSITGARDSRILPNDFHVAADTFAAASAIVLPIDMMLGNNPVIEPPNDLNPSTSASSAPLSLSCCQKPGSPSTTCFNHGATLFSKVSPNAAIAGVSTIPT